MKKQLHFFATVVALLMLSTSFMANASSKRIASFDTNASVKVLGGHKWKKEAKTFQTVKNNKIGTRGVTLGPTQGYAFLEAADGSQWYVTQNNEIENYYYKSSELSFYNSKGELVSTKVYTPKGFYNEFIGEDLESNYIMIMNDPTREYGKVYEIEYDRHVYDGENWLYINLPIERVKELAIASIKDNTAMYFSCDVGKFANRTKGTLDVNNFDYASLFRTSFPMDKKQRIQTYSSGSSHAMTLIAVDLDEQGKSKKWMVENSWGAASGYQGNLIMTDEWFNEYMFRVVVERKYVPEDILKLLEQEPILLPAWDPMFAPEE